jgi:UDP-N-acetylmuramoyl-L-alanyl-D-glutamate--2,6-diaminopimelate ligase
MWSIVETYSDIVIITDDDPDTENRLSIINQIQKWFTKKTLWKDLFIIPERKLAITFATKLAQEWDLLMFAGKGHETVQYTNFEKRKRSDKEEILSNIG